MKVINKLSVAGMTLLTLDGDVLSVNTDKVLVDGKEYEYTFAGIGYELLKKVKIESLKKQN